MCGCVVCGELYTTPLSPQKKHYTAHVAITRGVDTSKMKRERSSGVWFYHHHTSVMLFVFVLASTSTLNRDLALLMT